MSTFAPLIIGLTIVAILAIVVTLSRQGHGEDAAGHRFIREDRDSESIPRVSGGRPGGPGQSGQAVIAPGEIAPGNPNDRDGNSAT